MQIHIPPTLTNGNKYSSKTCIGATALDAATSYCSLYALFCPKSSALPCKFSTLSSSIFSFTSFKKFILLLIESNNVNFVLFLNIASGIPGNPAPVPTSITLSLFFIYFKIVKESTKCFDIISLSSVIAVKFIFSFHSSNMFIYLNSFSLSSFEQVLLISFNFFINSSLNSSNLIFFFLLFIFFLIVLNKLIIQIHQLVKPLIFLKLGLQTLV